MRLVSLFYDDCCCPHCGTAVRSRKRLTISEKCRIVEVLIKLAGSEDDGEIGSDPVEVYVLAHPGHATGHTTLVRYGED